MEFEREPHLAALRDALGVVLSGRGGVLVLLGGEAGGGKTALVRRFCRDGGLPGPVLWGACDPLFTPRPLGPFVDIAPDLGDDLVRLVESGAKPYQVAAAVARAVQVGTVVVVEDLHWADEATLDVLSLLGRRIGSIPALVVATYRDDELDRTHPLRALLGELRGASIRRLRVDPLSLDGVRAMARSSTLDAAALYRATSGNPFFVTEVLAAPGDDIPATVRDAVLARTARLTGAAATVAETVSIAVPNAELWLLQALVPEGADGLDRCLSGGILEAVPGGVAFRHELARLTVVESLSPHRRVALHREMLGALEAAAVGAHRPQDLARLAHHAEAADDGAAVLRFAVPAARHASANGAHREAAAQYARALRFAGGLPAEDRAALLDERSHECYLADQIDASVETLERAIELRRAAGDRLCEGASLTLLSRRLWCGGRSRDAARAAHEAVRRLEGLPPGPELALAYSGLAALHLNDERRAETLTWAGRAIDLAERLGRTDVVVHSLNNLGTMQILAGIADGAANLERSLTLAEQAGLAEHVGRAFVHAGWATSRVRGYDLAPWLDRGLQVCADHGLDMWRLHLLAYRARIHLDQGRWADAGDAADLVLRSAGSAPLLRILALTVLGLVRARRGDPDQWPPLDAAATLLAGQDMLQYHAPVALARAEAAWLDGRCAEVDDATRDALILASDRQASWLVGEFAWLRRLAGIREQTSGAAEPYRSQLGGDSAAAAQRWAGLGCPYDAALALVGSAGEADLRRALDGFHRLGARAAAAIAARRLRENGVRGLPRGPRPQTADHPAHLTRRETEVLSLVRQGARNAEIASRLFVSEKTVHHHVSAILRKLGVGSRGAAIAEAARLGLPTGQPQGSGPPV